MFVAVESALEVALRHDEAQAPRSPLWFAVPAVALVVLTLLGRRRWPFVVPASLWLLAAALSFVDGRLVVFSVGVYVAGMAAALLLGNVADAGQRWAGLAVVLAGAAIVVYNEPDHAAGEFLFVPVLFAVAWLAGFALRERAEQAEAAEVRAAQAEREREASARHAVLEERVRIARELHDVVAHHVSMMGVQAGAARVVIDGDPAKAKEALSAIESSSRRGGGGAAPPARVPAPGRRPRRPRAPAGARPARAAGGQPARFRPRRRDQRRGRVAHAAADGRRLGVPDRAGGADEHAQALRRVTRRRARPLLARRARGRDRRRRPPHRRPVAGVGRAGADRHARARGAARRAAQRRARGRRGLRGQGQAPAPRRVRHEHHDRAAGRRPVDGAGRVPHDPRGPGRHRGGRRGGHRRAGRGCHAPPAPRPWS